MKEHNIINFEETQVYNTGNRTGKFKPTPVLISWNLVLATN